MKNIQYIVLAVFILLVSNTIYTTLTKKSAKATRLKCQKEVVTFERIYDKSKIKLMQDLVKSGNFNIKSTIQKSSYMPTKLFQYVKQDEVDKIVLSELNSYKQKDTATNDKKLQIDYLIYENDKDNPGKKTKKSKLYAGYLLFDFKIDGKIIYKSQSDFMDMKGKDIPKRVKCIIKSLMTLRI